MSQVEKIKLPTNRRMYIVICCCLAQMIVWMDENAFLAAAPFWSAELGLDSVAVGSIQSAYMLGYFPMLFLGGVVADFIGPRKCLLIAVSVCGVLGLLMLACETYDQMYWRNLSFGVAFGFNWAPAMKMLSNWLPGKERGPRTSVWSLFSSVAVIVITPATVMICTNYDYHIVFILMAILSVPIFILIWFTADTPEKLKRISSEEVTYINQGRNVEALARDKFSLRSLGMIVKDRNCWIVLLAIVFASGPTWAKGPWPMIIYLDVFEMDPAFVSLWSGLLPLLPVAFSYTSSFWLNKVFKGNIKMFFVIAPLFGAIPYLLVGTVALPGIAVMLCFQLVQFANTFGWGGAGAYWGAYARPELWGTLNGLGSMMQTLFGYFLVNNSAHLILTDGRGTIEGYGNIFFVAGLMWILASVFGLLAKKVTTSDTWETVAAREGKNPPPETE